MPKDSQGQNKDNKENADNKNKNTDKTRNSVVGSSTGADKKDGQPATITIGHYIIGKCHN